MGDWLQGSELGSGFILESANMEGLAGKWELNTYTDELGVFHVRLSLEAAPDGESWEIIRPGEDGIPLETFLSSE